jgi:putative colanic acid biosynthesis UDP-glucose lipid carrier transferase
VAAVFLACLFAVPMILIALLVKVSSRGPIIYRQQRVGLDGKSFVMFKFRTMRVNAEAETGPMRSKRGDPRCTRVGAMLRHLSLDELPQLLNVLRGEMSMVGPRPEEPYFVEAFSRQFPTYRQRLQVLPGITGWAQVNGWRGDTSLERRIQFDLFYIRNWSVWFNIRILLLTPLTILIEDHGC